MIAIISRTRTGDDDDDVDDRGDDRVALISSFLHSSRGRGAASWRLGSSPPPPPTPTPPPPPPVFPLFSRRGRNSICEVGILEEAQFGVW